MRDIEELAQSIHDYMAEVVGPLVKRIAELEARPQPKDGRDGLNPDDIDLKLLPDGRTLQFSVERAIGDDVLRYSQEISLPVMIYRGVWEQKDYAHGDVVTHDGGMWHAQADTQTKPGESAEWKLAVKRGSQ